MSEQGTCDKKEYHPPKIVQTQKITTRAIDCNKSDDSCAQNGAPIMS